MHFPCVSFFTRSCHTRGSLKKEISQTIRVAARDGAAHEGIGKQGHKSTQQQPLGRRGGGARGQNHPYNHIVESKSSSINGIFKKGCRISGKGGELCE